MPVRPIILRRCEKHIINDKVDPEELKLLSKRHGDQEREKCQKTYHEHAAEVVRLSEANTPLREALEWYAYNKNHLDGSVQSYGGNRARLVLSSCPNEVAEPLQLRRIP